MCALSARHPLLFLRRQGWSAEILGCRQVHTTYLPSSPRPFLPFLPRVTLLCLPCHLVIELYLQVRSACLIIALSSSGAVTCTTTVQYRPAAHVILHNPRYITCFQEHTHTHHAHCLSCTSLVIRATVGILDVPLSITGKRCATRI